jgi:hypothetical protein
MIPGSIHAAGLPDVVCASASLCRIPCQPRKKLVVSFSAIAPHDRTQFRIGFQRGPVDGDRIAFEQSFIGQRPQHSAKKPCGASPESIGPRVREIVVWSRVAAMPHSESTLSK